MLSRGESIVLHGVSPGRLNFLLPPYEVFKALGDLWFAFKLSFLLNVPSPEWVKVAMLLLTDAGDLV